MKTLENDAQELFVVAGRLLDESGPVDSISRPLTFAALFTLFALPAAALKLSEETVSALAILAILGVVEFYFAQRVAFDAKLFRDVAARRIPDCTSLDKALLRLRLIPPTKVGRPLEFRIAGARRLLNGQTAMFVGQLCLIFVYAMQGTFR